MGGGLFGPDPENKVDLKFGTNNGTNDTSKHAKFYVLGFSTFRDMTSQNFPFQNGRVIVIRYLPPAIEQHSRKIIFYA